MDLHQHDRLLAASMASMATRRADSPDKAVAILMMASILVAESLRDEQIAYFHFVATIKDAFNALADATLETMAEMKRQQQLPGG